MNYTLTQIPQLANNSNILLMELFQIGRTGDSKFFEQRILCNYEKLQKENLFANVRANKIKNFAEDKKI